MKLLTKGWAACLLLLVAANGCNIFQGKQKAEDTTTFVGELKAIPQAKHPMAACQAEGYYLMNMILRGKRLNQWPLKKWEGKQVRIRGRVEVEEPKPQQGSSPVEGDKAANCRYLVVESMERIAKD